MEVWTVPLADDDQAAVGDDHQPGQTAHNLTNLIPQNDHAGRLPYQGPYGYAMAERMRTELVTTALDMAVRGHCLADG